MRKARGLAAVLLWIAAIGTAEATYINFEVSHVHPIDLTPSGAKLLAVNTPDALLEVFAVAPDGSLTPTAAVPVGLEPVTVVARTDSEAWVVNNLSDTVSIVNLDLGLTTKTLFVGDEPADVAFAAGKAFVAVSSEDAVKVYDLANLNAAPAVVPLFGRDVRALAVSNDGQKVYAVVLKSGNQTTILGVEQTFPNAAGIALDPNRLNAMGLRDIKCPSGFTPAYPSLPAGVVRNPALADPADGVPKVGLIVKWNEAQAKWQDETGFDWTPCLPYRVADNDLFVIDATSLAVTPVKHLGTSLFDVAVQPTTGKIYVPNTAARNAVRFEHPLGVAGHMVDNQLSVVDPASANAVTIIDLNTHINRASDPSLNLPERRASISQPGMLVWQSDGSAGYLTAIGSRKLFRVAGACLAGSCIFGPDRANPDVVEVGEGPTGVALLEAPQPADERLYVLNRISHSIAIVQASNLQLLDEIPLHDPSSQSTRIGRRFLYDGIDTSGHGDAACSSCHVSGDMDGLAWDLGNPAGDFASYSNTFDNVRFVFPFQNNPVTCPDNPGICASHQGFDPQKGPMTTQSLRGMLEPLHWRGDRATMNDFNKAFVGLMGTKNIGPINNQPAGVSAADMEKFRQFALALRYPPNPLRKVDDTTPCGTRAADPLCEVQVPGALFPGNPTEGDVLFHNHPSDAGQHCTSCHTDPFGAGGGQQGGVTPAQPASPAAAALFNGNADGSPHSDLKIPHVRNMYEKFGPVWAAPGDTSMPETKTGFGHIHDGAIPDLYRFLSASVFNLSAADQAQQVRDIVTFLFSFPTGIRPAVGRQVTLPQGSPPTGSAADEALLAALIPLGDMASVNRHCELVASTLSGGVLHAWRLQNGVWVPDVAGGHTVTTANLRLNAGGPLTFTCATLGSGLRLGGDRDEDNVLNGNDCADGDAQTFAAPVTVTDLEVGLQGANAVLTWDDETATTGLSLRYDVLGGDLSALQTTGIGATSCVADGIASPPTYQDTRPDPPAGDGYYYLIRAVNPCGVGDLGPGLRPLETLACR